MFIFRGETVSCVRLKEQRASWTTVTVGCVSVNNRGGAFDGESERSAALWVNPGQRGSPQEVTETSLTGERRQKSTLFRKNVQSTFYGLVSGNV